MDRTEVESANIHSVGYDSETRTLEIEFRKGGLYHYYNVPPQIHAELVRSRSPGAYLHDNIKKVYRTEKVG